MLKRLLNLEDQKLLLDEFLKRYLARGFKIISRSPTTAELFRPHGSIPWLQNEKTLFVDLDDRGRIYIRKR